MPLQCKVVVRPTSGPDNDHEKEHIEHGWKCLYRTAESDETGTKTGIIYIWQRYVKGQVNV